MLAKISPLGQWSGAYTRQQELLDLGAPKGQRFQFSMALADSKIFDGKDSTLDPKKPVNVERSIVVYVPAQYQDGSPAPLLIIQDGPGDIGMVQNALDNLTISDDPARRLPPFVAIAVQNGGNDAQGSERGLEYDTMSERYARFINVNENDLRADDDESTHHNWVMANERTAAALAAQSYHYRYVFGRGAGHCDGNVRGATLVDALIWVWRGYEPTQQ